MPSPPTAATPMSLASPRLIEKGFPCHEVGAETRRERNASSALPPHFFLHVWWARRPLVPSRAAVLGSILEAREIEGHEEDFIRELGIEVPWVQLGPIAECILPPEYFEKTSNHQIAADSGFIKFLEKEQKERSELRAIKDQLVDKIGNTEDAVITHLDRYCKKLPSVQRGALLDVQLKAGEPSWFNNFIDFGVLTGVRVPNLYGYSRAYQRQPVNQFQGLTFLDPTAGGGSIPLEAQRLGCKTFANELNPVASVILEATLNSPQNYKSGLIQPLERYGEHLVNSVSTKLEPVYANTESVTTFLYCRQITSPYCGKPVPLFNGTYLSKVEGDKWAMRVRPTEDDRDVQFEFYPANRGLESPRDHGLNLLYDGKTKDWRSVQGGNAICIWTGQEIDGDEVKRQARSGEMTDRMMCVVAKRWVPVKSTREKGRTLARILDPSAALRGKKQVALYESLSEDWQVVDTKEFPTTVLKALADKGVIECRKEKEERFFRAPTSEDLQAFTAAETELQRRWQRWDEQGLIPTERFPEGNDMRPRNYGMPRWCDLFNSHQLLGHLTATEALLEMKPRILEELGPDKRKAVITYLQFMIDKGLDYNSRQTRWDTSSRQKVINTFGRHDFSIKWVYGEMVYAGGSSGLAWGLSQVLDAYSGLVELVQDAPGQVEILQGSAAQMDPIESESVDVIVNDPPYYDNVQYAELADYFYVWQRRTLADLYPDFFRRRETNKQDEAVANPVRDGSAKAANKEYEERMQEIYAECRRVLKPDGVMTIMFTHKKAEAWDTLTRALITSGWRITSTYPIESESTHSMHQMGKASAASSLFLVCRKREETPHEPAAWRLGEGGVQAEVEEAVRASLPEFESIGLSPVDRMVAAYGRALQVISDRWPVVDGEEEISPVQAISEASLVVAEREIERITGGDLSVTDLSPEAALAVIAFGVWGIAFPDKESDSFVIPFDSLNQVSRSLGISLRETQGSYRLPEGQRVGFVQKGGKDLYAPLKRRGSHLRLALPEERAEARLERPQTEWDALLGALRNYRRGGTPLVRAYLREHQAYEETALKLLKLWSEQIIDPVRTKEAKLILLEW